MDSNLTRLFQHPLVLNAAWKKLQPWYRFGEGHSLSEFTSWRLDPTRHLSELSQSLIKGSYTPEPFKMVPYPKKGGLIRHYTRPSIRDQVAFTIFGVLLAPILETRMPNFSFGNRWHRGISRRMPDIFDQLPLFNHGDGQTPRPVWTSRPFSLSGEKLYQPYRRSYGLFRRAAHWAATAMLDVQATDTTATDRPRQKEDYAEDHLPPFVHRQWWEGHGQNTKGYWVHLDLQLAYPSISIDLLRPRLLTILGRDGKTDEQNDLIAFGVQTSLNSSLRGYPSSIAEILVEPDVHLDLANLLLDLLQKVSLEPLPSAVSQNLRDGMWLPPHAYQNLPLGDGTNFRSLPTGLAISGLLMNVALTGMDTLLAKWMAGQGKNRSAAFLRFADDMLLLATDVDTLAAGIDLVWEGLSLKPSDPTVNPALTTVSKPEDSNLRVNWTKVDPEPVSALVQMYLGEQGWTECDGCKRIILPPKGSSPKMRFASWVAELNKQFSTGERDSKTERFREKFLAVEASTLRHDRLQPFVTYLVERLSALGQDTLRDRFGLGLNDRLTQLHELVRFDLQDSQVREDTRLAFAASRLTRAWLPEDSADAARASIAQIRRSIHIAISKAPWQFSLWISAVKAAARRPPGLAASEDDKVSEDWLTELLGHIRLGNEATQSLGEDHSDTLRWSEDKDSGKCLKHHQLKAIQSADPQELFKRRRELTLSYLRTSFWQAIRIVVLELSRLCSRLESTDESAVVPNWTSDNWAFRSLSEEEIRPILEWLSRLDRWALCLYPEEFSAESKRCLKKWWWERDALSGALLAATSRGKILHDLSVNLEHLDSPTPNEILEIDSKLLSQFNKSSGLHRVGQLLKRAPKKKPDHTTSRTPPWITLALAGHTTLKNEELAQALAQQVIRSPSLGKEVSHILRLSRELDAFTSIPPYAIDLLANQIEFNRNWWAEPETPLEKLWSLETYGLIRELAISLAPPIESSTTEPTIYSLLWGCGLEALEPPAGFSEPLPALAPEVGLPIRVALAMLSDALAALPPAHETTEGSGHNEPPKPSIWMLYSGAQETAKLGRAIQFGRKALSYSDVTKNSVSKWAQVSLNPEHWNIWPHPSYFYPWILDMMHGGEVAYHLWCHILQFYTAVMGSERFLSALFQHGIGTIPLVERWDLRGDVPMPTEMWECLDQFFVLCGFHSSKEGDSKDLDEIIAVAKSAIEKVLSVVPASIQDFRWEKADIRLELESGFEVPGFVVPFTLEPPQPPYDSDFKLKHSQLADNLSVRVGQIRSTPSWKDAPFRFPNLTRAETQSIMREVWAVLYSDQRSSGTSPDRVSLAIFPEVGIPRSEKDVLRRVAAEQEVGIFAGLYWKVVPTAVRAHTTAKGRLSFFVNEATLMIPLKFARDNGPSIVRTFTIQKPVPATVERGLALALSEIKSEDWNILPGRRWYRFVHPVWGDFTVAICSDLLDASPWTALRGTILHLFMCSYNKDVELYEALTWIRAYENYVNVVSVNHGAQGGSFVWSPRHGEGKEIARLRGEKLFLSADVLIPVKELHSAQADGLNLALKRQAAEWLEKKVEKKGLYKSPPPEFPGDRRKL